MIKLSIVTPTFNRYKEIQKNIKSVKNQTYRNKEHIIVDNMSDDGTYKIIENYKKRADYPVVYIREPDKGIYNAMNKGIKAAKGQWIHILNSDDYYYNNKTLENVFKKNLKSYDIIACSIIRINLNNSIKDSLGFLNILNQ